MYLYTPHAPGHPDYNPHPQFQIRGSGVYSTLHNTTPGTRDLPWYEVRGNKIYSTTVNPSGHSPHALYEIHGDHVYATLNNPERFTHSARPIYALKKH